MYKRRAAIFPAARALECEGESGKGVDGQCGLFARRDEMRAREVARKRHFPFSRSLKPRVRGKKLGVSGSFRERSGSRSGEVRQRRRRRHIGTRRRGEARRSPFNCPKRQFFYRYLATAVPSSGVHPHRQNAFTVMAFLATRFSNFPHLCRDEMSDNKPFFRSLYGKLITSQLVC